MPLHVLLRRAGVTQVTATRRFVCFSGPDGELPKGADGMAALALPFFSCTSSSTRASLSYEVG